MSPDRTGAGLVVVLTLAALGVRAVGLDFGLPVWEEPDAVIAMHVDKLRAGTDRPDRRWSDQEYPHLIAQLVRRLPDRPPEQGPGAPETMEEHLAAASHTHLQVRLVVALLSVLAIPGTWLLARRFLSPPAALLAAGFTASSLLLFHFSQQGRPHAPAGALFVLAVVAAMRLARTGRTADFALAGVAASLALGVLHTGVFVLPALAAAFVLRPAQGARRLLDARALLVLALLALSVRVFYPFFFGGQLGEEFGTPEVEGGQVTLAEHQVRAEQFLHGGGFRVVGLSLWYYDPVLLVLAGVSTVAWVAARARGAARVGGGGARTELLVALAFCVPYALVIGMFEKTYERFAIPLLPYLACAAAWGASALAARFGRAAWALALLAALAPAAACTRLAVLRARPDTLDHAAAWVEQHVEPPGRLSVVAAGFFSVDFDLPLSRTAAQFRTAEGKRIRQHSPWSRYLARLPDERRPGPRYGLRWMVPETRAENQLMKQGYADFLLSLRPGYYVIEPFEKRYDVVPMLDLRRILREHGERVARLSPEGPEGDREWPFFYALSDHFNEPGYHAWPHFYPRLFRADAIGPYVEIYRLD